MRVQLWIAAAAALLTTAGCGGGGGGGGSGPVKPTGDFTAFLSDGTQAGRVELFVADADGTNVRAVSGVLDVDDGDVTEFAWSPDRARIAYLQDTDGDGHAELFVVDPAVGAPMQLRDPGSILGATIFDFAWSPTSQHVAFRETASLVDPARLWVVPAAGGSPVDVSGTITAGGFVMPGYQWRPSSTTRIAFRGDLATDGKFQLFTNTLAGNDRRLMSDFALNPNAQVEPDFAWAHDGSRIAFRGDLLLAGQVDLYTNDPDGGDEVLESDAFGVAVDVTTFQWSPTASVLAYTQDAATDEVLDLLTVVSPDGTPVDVTNFPMLSNLDVVDYAWSPDGSRLAVRSDEQHELSTAPWSGGGMTSIELDVAQYKWSPDGTRLAYVQEPSIDSPFDSLHTVGPTGGNRKELSDTQTAGSTISRITWSPDGSRMLYVTDEGGDGGFDLRVVGSLGGGSILLDDAGGPIDGVQFEAFSSNSEAVCFLGGFTFQNNVYSVLVDGTDEVDLCLGLLATADSFDVQMK